MESSKGYDFGRAVADGLLLDVSHIAAKVGLNYPTFISSGLWNSRDFERSEARVLLALEGVREYLVSFMPKGKDSAEVGIAPDLMSRGWPRAACPNSLPVKVVRERSERFGWVVFVLQVGESLDFRIPEATEGGTLFAH